MSPFATAIEIAIITAFGERELQLGEIGEEFFASNACSISRATDLLMISALVSRLNNRRVIWQGIPPRASGRKCESGIPFLGEQ
ncbi:MAG: hypothetical protein KJZ80_04910 [Hyphomicrobiaceae bacterium]|nr:hypothetical protein [Hyphomicrobiaceae bacterium]